MYKIEMTFDNSLPAETVNRYCEETDKIFTEEGVTVAEKSFGKRTYIDETEDACMNVGAALISIRKNKELSQSLKTAYYYENLEPEDLMELFFYEYKKVC